MSCLKTRDSMAPGLPTTGPDPNPSIVRALPLLHVVARRLYVSLRQRVDYDELVGIGRLALVELMHQPEARCLPVSTHLRRRLRWAMLDALRKQTHGRQSFMSQPLSLEPLGPVAIAPELSAPGGRPAVLACSLGGATRVRHVVGGQGGGFTPLDPGRTPEAQVLARADRRRLHAAVAALPSPQRKIIEHHYFLDRSLERIADELGMSRSWACRLHTRGLQTLRIMLLRRDAPGLRTRPAPGLRAVRARVTARAA